MKDQYSREIAIFLVAIETTGTEELRTYLNDACGGDRQLRNDVEALLVAHLKDNSFLEHPAPNMPSNIDFHRQALDAGLAATFGPDAAVVMGHTGHSVLKSLSKGLPNIPKVSLREHGEREDKVLQPGSKEFSSEQTDSHYQLLGEIARGGMGAIIKGRDTDLGRDLAIKVLLDVHKNNPDMLQRFVEEAQISGQLQHPGIVPVYELGQFADQRPFFSMKLVRGETLAELLSSRKTFHENLPRLLGIFEQVCQAMAYAHNKGVVHRDLKPANIMIGAFGEVQVMDWGLSKVLSTGGVADERRSLDKHRNVSVIQTRRSTGSDAPGEVGSQTLFGSVMGTPAYMPPEQALGEIDRLDERADVFGLGAILAEILTGKPPYVADDATQVFRMASRGKLDECHARLNANGADRELIELAKRALSAEVDDRQRNAGELSAGITQHLEGVQSRLKQAELAKVAAETRSEEQRRRKKLYMAIAGMLLLVALSGAGSAVLYKRIAVAQTELAQSQTELAQSKSDLADDAQRNSDVQVQLRKDAEKETQRANVMRLAAEAQRIDQDHPIQSTLLAMEAVKMSDDFELWPIPIVHATLLKSVANLGGAPLLTQAGAIEELIMSQNDRLITKDFHGLGVSEDDSFRVYNLNQRNPAAASLKLELVAGMRASSAAISANGKRVVTTSLGKVRVWELSAESDQVLSWKDLPGEKGNAAVAISSDGQWIVNSEQLWRIDEENQAHSVAKMMSTIAAKRFAICPNNHWLVMVTADSSEGSGKLFLWDLQAPDVAGSIQTFEHAGIGPSLAIGQNGRWLVTGNSNGARLFDLTAKDVFASVRKLTDKELRKIAMSGDCRWLLAAGVDSMLFDLSGTDPASTVIILRGYDSSGRSVAISPDGRWLATGDKVARIWALDSLDPAELPILREHAGTPTRLWDINATESKGRTHVLHSHDQVVNDMYFTSDSRQLLTGSLDGSVRTWDVRSENPGRSAVLSGHTARISVVAISPNRRWLVTGSEDHTARLWDLTSDSPSATSIVLPHSEFVRTLAISPDSHWLVTASGHQNLTPQGVVTEAHVWDLEAEDPSKSMRLLSGHTKAITYVKISPDSRRVVTLSYDTTARVWSLDGAPAAQEPRVLVGHATHVPSVAFGPDSNFLVTGDISGVVRLWDLTKPDPVPARVLLEQEDWIMGLSLEANRARALTAGWQRNAHIWDLDLNSSTHSTSRELPKIGLIDPYVTDFRGHYMGLPNAYKGHVWDLSADHKQSPYLIHAHEDGLWATAFSPDGSRFASCGKDRTAFVSNLSADNPLNTTLVLRGHNSDVYSIAISSDNRWVLTGSSDNTARLWDMDIKRLMVRARELVGRELTDSERTRFLLPLRTQDSD
jgi:WD40 repeat protein/serine/threonine protein kinase